MSSQTRRRFDPLGQNATDEELIDELAKILIEGFLAKKAQETEGEDKMKFKEALASFRFQQLLMDPYSEIPID